MLAFQIVEQRANSFDIAQCGLVEQVGLPPDDQDRAVAGIFTPYREPPLDQIATGFVEGRFAAGNLLFDHARGLRQGPSGASRGEIVARLLERRAERLDRKGDNPVLDMSVFAHQNSQHSVCIQRGEGYLCQLGFACRHHHHACRARKIGQQGAGFFQCSLDRSRLRKALLDCGTFFAGRLGDLHHRIDEKTKARFRRHSTRTGMRCRQQSALLEFGQHRTYRRRRKVHPPFRRERLGTHGCAAFQIPFDHEPEDVPCAIGQICEWR